MPDSEQQQHRSWSHVEEAVEALRNGRMVIVVDSEDRENEGDFVCAAESVTPEMIDFMLRIGRGVLCAPMTRETAERLRLPSVVEEDQNTAAHKTPFHMKIDHRDAGTGVSPIARAKTLNELANPNAHEHDFVRPGHIDPLVAREGRSPPARRAHGGDGRPVPPRGPRAGRRADRDPRRRRRDGPAGPPSGDRGGARSADHHDRGADPLPDEHSRTSHLERAHELRSPDLAVRAVSGSIAYQVQTRGRRSLLALVMGRPLVESTRSLWSACTSSCLTGDLLDSLRCDCGRSAPHGDAHDPARGGRSARLSAAGGAGDRAERQAQGVSGSRTKGTGHGRGQPGKLGFTRSDVRDYMRRRSRS
jgi:3,4-dihydroxy 2-butanone 4-phosphate synthase / GTP cyclohydrolase II